MTFTTLVKRMVLVLALVVPGLLVVGASSASTATPTCNSWKTIWWNGYRFEVPSLGRNGSTVCALRLYDGYNGGGPQSAVFVLQGSLNSCDNAGLVLDGKYGPRTRDAVAWVTAARGVPAPSEGVGAYNQVVLVFAIKLLGQRTNGGQTLRVCRSIGQIV